MPKRKHENETSEERWLRKMKKYGHKLQAKRARRIIYSDEENDVQTEEHLEYDLDLSVEQAVSEECHNESAVSNYDEVNNVCHADTGVLCGDDKSIEDTTPADEVSDFDPTLLQALGDIEPDAAEFGDNLHADVAKQLEKILLYGLKKDNRDELLKKYLIPKNLPSVKSPELNPEIGGMLAEVCKLRDKRLQVKQNQIGKSLSALGKAITELLKKNPDIPNIIRTLNDAGKLVADSHFAETDTRRAVIIPLVDKSLAEPFKERKRDNFLFGDNLGDLVKNSRGIKRTSQMIQATPSTSVTNLNGRGSSTRTRHPRSTVTYPYRTGGPRQTTSYSYPNRRRGFPPPPPPPPPQRFARRQPPPPPLPPRRQPGPAPVHRPPVNRTT